MNHFNASWVRCARWLLTTMLLWLSFLGIARAAEPDNVSVSHKICNLPDNTTLPNGSGQFICADADYSGNAGKNWNELDLVPLRLELTATNAAPATQTYTLAVVVDREDVAKPGFDFLSVPVLNTAKSAPGCLAPTTVGAPQLLSPGSGGTDAQLYRLVTFTQSRGKACVYDYYARLALGSHLFPGASLHANVLTENLTTGGIGNQDRSIPVNEISPQEMSKTMAATQNAERAWNVTKTATPGNLDFGDVCKAPAGPLEKEVQVTVTWSKLAVTPAGDVTVITNINVKNPAARTITVNVTDTVYAGMDATGTPLASQSSGDIDVAANFSGLLKTFTYTVPASAAGSIGAWLSDKAVATYTDKVTGIPVPGNVTATAAARIQLGTTLNETANIADLETIGGTGLSFKVDEPSTGNFVGYTAGALATSVNWEVSGLNADGSVVFSKKVVLDQPRITTGELTDVATLVSTDSGFTTGATLFPVSISSSATVSLTVAKTIPLALKAGESVVVNFTVTPTGGGAGMPVAVTFTGPTAIGAGAEAVLTGLAPASYTVTEGSSMFYDAAHPAGMALNIVPTEAQQTVDLSPKPGGIMDAGNCSGTASFVNVIADTEFPSARVAKITLPAQTSADDGWAWNFTLTGPAGFVAESVTANAGQGFVAFQAPLKLEGTYTVTETLRPGWDLTGVIQPDGSSATTVCTFVVDFPADFGKALSCTFTNTERGAVRVVKTLSGQPTTQPFTFQLRTGASLNADGTALETLTTNTGGNGSTLAFTTPLVPATRYQMCESTQAGWMTSFNTPDSPLYVPGAFLPPGTTIPNEGVDNSWLCVDFQVAPGETKTFNIDNVPPPGGRALTIGYWKNHASCTTSSTNKAPALDAALYVSGGILKRSRIDSLVFADHTTFGLYGQNVATTADCPYAVKLLDKRNFAGVKKATDPLFGMAAQLVAAELNLASGAYTCPAVSNAVVAAEGLLQKYAFTGAGYTPSLTKPDATLANTTAARLDDYNNNRAGVCP